MVTTEELKKLNNSRNRYNQEVDFILRSIYQDNKTVVNRSNMVNYQKLRSSDD